MYSSHVALELLSKWSASGEMLRVKFKGSVVVNLNKVSLRTFSEMRFDFVDDGVELIGFSTLGAATFSAKDGVVRVSSGNDNLAICVSTSVE